MWKLREVAIMEWAISGTYSATSCRYSYGRCERAKAATMLVRPRWGWSAPVNDTRGKRQALKACGVVFPGRWSFSPCHCQPWKHNSQQHVSNLDWRRGSTSLQRRSIRFLQIYSRIVPNHTFCLRFRQWVLDRTPRRKSATRTKCHKRVNVKD